jgi:hypothetical protein
MTAFGVAKKPIDQISEAMGHSTIAINMNHYVGGMNSDEILELTYALF